MSEGLFAMADEPDIEPVMATKWTERMMLDLLRERHSARSGNGVRYAYAEHVRNQSAYLVPSSTPGHSHLYVDLHVPEVAYFRLLDALADAGVIQSGFANSSKHRGGTALRLPWVKKESIAPLPTPSDSDEPPL